MQVSSLLASEPKTSPTKHNAKSVCFELLLDERSKTRARIPLRVLVNLHDTTESIITTVKSFYGIYDGNGISFEDAMGNTLIASFDNFNHDTTVYVRTVAGASQLSANGTTAAHINMNSHDGQRRSSLGEPFQMLHPHLRDHSQSPTRSSGRQCYKRSVSPQRGRANRSVSQQKRGSNAESRGSSVNGSYHEDGYSDSEAGQSSVSGSKKARSEQFASSEISTANVLQDGRRGQTIFDSSTLPLFAPPQVPVTASQSSISPQRRSLPHEGPSPFQLPAQKLYDMNAPPLLSPQSYNNNVSAFATFANQSSNGSSTPQVQHGHHLRGRYSNISQSKSGYNNTGILPTPDPTVASCISDEDVARTLIALGDASNYSHGRTSTSTLDDTFSGIADAASSTGATSDSDEYSDEEGGLPKHRKYLDDGDDDEYNHDTTAIKSEFDEYDGPPKTKKIKTKLHDGPSGSWTSPTTGLKASKSGKSRPHHLFKAQKSSNSHTTMKAPAFPNGQPRKTSSSSSINLNLGIDEEDLSTKPRCQRCRKSKKGCDRQRPCGRCKDAGIGIEGCVSEDEGNGRKGRYGRHMGVPVKKTEHGYMDTEATGLAVDAMDVGLQGSPSKKRKR